MARRVTTGFGVRDYWRMLRARGPAYPFHYFTQVHLFDLRYGTDTHVRFDPSRYEPRPADFDRGIWYVCSPTDVLIAALGEVQALLGPSFTDFQFVDLGCGKGKALLIYGLRFACNARWPAIGLEYHAPLTEIAASNLAKLGLSDACKVCCADARDLDKWISSDRSILFLYNPFDAGILRDVLEAPSNRETIVVYVDPAHDVVAGDLGFRTLSSTRGRYPNRCFDIYASRTALRGRPMSRP